MEKEITLLKILIKIKEINLHSYKRLRNIVSSELQFLLVFFFSRLIFSSKRKNYNEFHIL